MAPSHPRAEGRGQGPSATLAPGGEGTRMAPSPRRGEGRGEGASAGAQAADPLPGPPPRGGDQTRWPAPPWAVGGSSPWPVPNAWAIRSRPNPVEFYLLSYYNV